mgnify:CR=1 FL=1
MTLESSGNSLVNSIYEALSSGVEKKAIEGSCEKEEHVLRCDYVEKKYKKLLYLDKKKSKKIYLLRSNSVESLSLPVTKLQATRSWSLSTEEVTTSSDESSSSCIGSRSPKDREDDKKNSEQAVSSHKFPSMDDLGYEQEVPEEDAGLSQALARRAVSGGGRIRRSSLGCTDGDGTRRSSLGRTKVPPNTHQERKEGSKPVRRFSSRSLEEPEDSLGRASTHTTRREGRRRREKCVSPKPARTERRRRCNSSRGLQALCAEKEGPRKRYSCTGRVSLASEDETPRDGVDRRQYRRRCSTGRLSLASDDEVSIDEGTGVQNIQKDAGDRRQHRRSASTGRLSLATDNEASNDEGAGISRPRRRRANSSTRLKLDGGKSPGRRLPQRSSSHDLIKVQKSPKRNLPQRSASHDLTKLKRSSTNDLAKLKKSSSNDLTKMKKQSRQVVRPEKSSTKEARIRRSAGTSSTGVKVSLHGQSDGWWAAIAA